MERDGLTLMDAPPVHGTRPLKVLPTLPAEWLDLPEPYTGLRVRAWLDFPERLWQEMQAPDEAVQRAALQRIVLEHDGWADADGALPQPTDAAFWERISTRLLVAILATVRVECYKPPGFSAQEEQQLTMLLRAPNPAGLPVPWVWTRECLARRYSVLPSAIDALPHREVQTMLRVAQLEGEAAAWRAQRTPPRPT